MTNIAVIPARGGSQRIPLKNVRAFRGKPIIAYSIECAERSGLFSAVWVSTEDPRVASVARAWGAFVLDRPIELSHDHVGTQDVMAHACEALTGEGDYACCLYATAPLMLPADLHEGVRHLRSRPIDYAFSVGAEPLRDAGQWYWGHAKSFIERRPLVSASSVMVPIPEARVCDINTEHDWEAALYKFGRLHEGVA